MIPNDFNFQYFFFSTYPGYALQLLPFALLAAILYAVYKNRQIPRDSSPRIFLSALFVAYFTTLIGLTLLQSLISDVYYFLFYHVWDGSIWPERQFIYNFIPNFFRNFNDERIANIFLFLPFGFLYPQFRQRSPWFHTLAVGVLTSFAIEFIQPFVGRSFDVNDLILNATGLLAGIAIYYPLHALTFRRRVRRNPKK